LNDEHKIYEITKKIKNKINPVTEDNQQNTSNCEKDYDCSVNKIYEKIYTILDDRNPGLKFKHKADNILNLLNNDIKPGGIIYNTIANDIPNNNKKNYIKLKVFILFLEKEIIKKINESEKRCNDENRFCPDEGLKVYFIEKIINTLKSTLSDKIKKINQVKEPKQQNT